MLRRIVVSIIFISLLIAIPLSLMGYKQVELGTPFLALMKSVSRDLEEFKIAIPDIPNIPAFESGQSGWFDALNVLISIGNAFIGIINILSMITNVVISVIQVVVLVVKNLINFKDVIAQYNPLVI